MLAPIWPCEDCWTLPLHGIHISSAGGVEPLMRAEDRWTEETQLATASHDEEEKAPCMAWSKNVVPIMMNA